MRQSTCHHDLECYHVCGDLWIEMLQSSVRLQADYSFLTSQSPLSFVKHCETVRSCFSLPDVGAVCLRLKVSKQWSNSTLHPSMRVCVCVCVCVLESFIVRH